jgi:ABC-2 type transport system permease protein
MTAAAPATQPAVAPWPRVLVAQTRASVLSLWRVPAFTISGLLLPLMLFGFFGLRNPGSAIAGTTAGPFFLASFGAYAVGSMMVFNFGLGVAGERAAKIDLLFRASPLPPLLYLVAKVITGIVFALLSLLLLFAFGTIAGGIRLGPALWVTIIARLLVGALPLIGLGFAIGYRAGPGAAPGVANLIYLPMSFASGLFTPLESMPAAIQRIAPLLPTYHVGQLAWGAVGARAESPLVSALWLAAYAVLFFAIAVRAYYAEEQRKFR